MAARLLGVTREHLNRVLNGRRQSRSLLRRHTALKKTGGLA
jgi:CRP-like cAMP-binding protein